MKRLAWLVVGGVVVSFAGLLVWRELDGAFENPPPEHPVAPAGLTDSTVTPAPVPTPSAPAAVVAPPPSARAVPTENPPPNPTEPSPPSAPPEFSDVDVVGSPFDSDDSAELRYAVDLLYGPDAGRADFIAAGEVFERCLKHNAAHPRCLRGLVAAQNAIAAGSVLSRDQALLAPPATTVSPGWKTPDRNIDPSPAVNNGVRAPLVNHPR